MSPIPEFEPVPMPRLETPRLILRARGLDDFDVYAGMWADPAVVHYIGPPLSRDEAWEKYQRMMRHWPEQGHGFWLIEERETQTFVGEIGFTDHKRDMTPSFGATPEAGWVLTAGQHGKGYASEALTAALGWADAHLPDPRTVCMIHPDNAGSRRLAEKHGYAGYARTTYKDRPAILFERFK